jgi:hypothetical protein
LDLGVWLHDLLEWVHLLEFRLGAGEGHVVRLGRQHPIAWHQDGNTEMRMRFHDEMGDRVHCGVNDELTKFPSRAVAACDVGANAKVGIQSVILLIRCGLFARHNSTSDARTTVLSSERA